MYGARQAVLFFVGGGGGGGGGAHFQAHFPRVDTLFMTLGRSGGATKRVVLHIARTSPTGPVESCRCKTGLDVSHASASTTATPSPH